MNLPGTAGQRCTTLRRLVLHEKIYDEFVSKLVSGYSKVNAGRAELDCVSCQWTCGVTFFSPFVFFFSQIKPGNPLDADTLLGPLHNEGGVREYLEGLEEIKKQGGKVGHQYIDMLSREWEKKGGISASIKRIDQWMIVFILHHSLSPHSRSCTEVA